MADYAFLAPIFDYVDTAVNTYVAATVANVANEVAPVARGCMVLYLVMYGFAYYRGLIQEPLQDMAFRFMRAAFIVQLAISTGQYSGLIANNLLAAPDYLTSVFGGTSGSTVGSAKTTLDQILSDALNTGSAVWEQGSILPPGANPGAYLMAMLIWMSALICIGYAAFLIILSKVFLGVIVAAGPAFELLLLFEGTRKFFDSWLGQALNYALTAGFTVGVVSMLFGMYKKAATGSLAVAAASDFGFMSIASMLILSVVCFLILMQVQQVAAQLAGGVAVSTMGAARAVAGKMMDAAKGAGSMRPSQIEKQARKTATGIRRDIDSTKRAGQWVGRKFTGIDASMNTIKRAA